MVELHTHLSAFRAFLMAACLGFLGGCGGGGGSGSGSDVSPTVATPVNLVASSGNAVVALSWAASTGATSYNVKRATTSGGPYAQLGSTASTGYTDSSVTNATTYYYVVSALSGAGESANSTAVSATPQAAATAPPIPGNLAATPGDAQVTLTWTVSSGATSYNIKRATTSGGPYVQISSSTVASYTDNSTTDGTTYYYVVSAANSAGESANSGQASATPSTGTPPTIGTWINVTPSGVSLTASLSCGNYGAQTVQADPGHAATVYAQFHCQGIWKSTDYGATWTGPINTGTHAVEVTDCAGGITVSHDSTASVPTIYQSCIRGTGGGFWKSTDGGVNWTKYVIAATSRQDYLPPVIDPYDSNHLLMTGHEFDSIVESVDGGQSWTSVTLANGMLQTNGTGFVFFINTGSAATTRGTWLWLGQASGGRFGTWRTSSSGTTWLQVDTNENTGGASQIYQPGTNGVTFMAGQGSAQGNGVLRSTDYGQTWTHVGLNKQETVVIGSSKNVYAMVGYPAGPGNTVDPSEELAAQPGTGTWVAPGTPAGLTQGPAQLAVVNDGTQNIVLGAMWNSGLWRYVEP